MPVMAKLGVAVSVVVCLLRMGAVTFGGGFVMVPLIEAEVVRTNHWLTQQEFADATALGQITPDPVLITATFIGYRVAGTLGALVSNGRGVSPGVPDDHRSGLVAAQISREQAGAVISARSDTGGGWIIGVGCLEHWSRAGIHTWVGLSLCVLAAALLLRFRLNPFWVILGVGVTRLGMGIVFGM